MRYRPEIDGLRAVAIAPVVLFHAGFSFFSGGFVGVDVFFVISGYLITSLLVVEKTAGTFSLATFVERRARRILPALFVMLVACIPFAWLLMSPAELRNFGSTVVAVNLFSSNFWLFFHTGYFSLSALKNPLLHTWTLAVEEQFYLLFPPLMLLVWPLGRRFAIATVAALLLASFAFAHLGGSFNAHFPFIDRDWTFMASNFGFYLTPARGWELMIGAIVALCFPGKAMAYGRVSEAGSIAGLALIICSTVAFDASTPMPSVYTLIPVLGAALILLFATERTLIGRLLSHRLLVGLGLISYGVYLWHQPIFAFARLAVPNLGGPALVALSAASLCAGYLSWRYIELPFRAGGWFDGRRALALAGAMGAVLIGVSSVFIATDGALSRFPEPDRYLASFDPEQEGSYVTARFNALDRSFDLSDPRPRIVVIGDSFAEDFINMAAENGALRDYQITTLYVPATCQLVVPAPPDSYCQKSSPLSAGAQQRIRQAAIVILSALWSVASAERLPVTLNALGIARSQRLYVIGSKQLGPVTPAAYLALREQVRWRVRNPTRAIAANDTLRAHLSPGVFVDIAAAICEHGSCPVFTPDRRLLSFDGYHLTSDGAKYCGRLLFAKTALARLNDRRIR